jgi:hypothetical protein
MDIKVTEYEDLDWNNVTQDTDQWRAPYSAGKFLTR